MGSFTTRDQIINALSSLAYGEARYFWKQSSTTQNTATAMYSTWPLAGIPVAGGYGTNLIARTLDNTVAGSLPFTSASGGRSKYAINLRSKGGRNGAGSGVQLLLVDRLLDVKLDGTVTSGTFNSGTPLAIPARDMGGAANGDGVMMFVESIAMSASPNLTVTYTNQGGTGGHSTGAQALTSSVAARLPYTDNIWFPLASGDTGVRKLESYTLSGSAGAGSSLAIVLCRPLVGFIIPSMQAPSCANRDFIVATPYLPRLYDGTCLQFILIATNLAPNADPIEGILTMAEI